LYGMGSAARRAASNTVCAMSAGGGPTTRAATAWRAVSGVLGRQSVSRGTTVFPGCGARGVAGKMLDGRRGGGLAVRGPGPGGRGGGGGPRGGGGGVPPRPTAARGGRRPPPRHGRAPEEPPPRHAHLGCPGFGRGGIGRRSNVSPVGGCTCHGLALPYGRTAG